MITVEIFQKLCSFFHSASSSWNFEPALSAFIQLCQKILRHNAQISRLFLSNHMISNFSLFFFSHFYLIVHTFFLPKIILVPRALRFFLNCVSCSSGNGNKFEFFDWPLKNECATRDNILPFYAYRFSSGWISNLGPCLSTCGNMSTTTQQFQRFNAISMWLEAKLQVINVTQFCFLV